MEILKGYVTDVKFPVPGDLTSATASISGVGFTATPATTTVAAGVAVVSVPFSAVQSEQDLTITLSFTYEGSDYSSSKTVSIVTPILESWEIEPLLECSDETDIWGMERAVRHIVNAHTGQTFGKFIGTKIASGNGENALPLPARLITLNDITLNTPGLPVYGTFQISGDGWYLEPTLFPYDGYNIKADADGFTETNGVIFNPYGRSTGIFSQGTKYTIDGVWGYEEVPEPVREAAKLLIGDYASMDSIYRDRQLVSLTSPDWRIQFYSGAFLRTGNVRADQLLSDFVLKRGWAII